MVARSKKAAQDWQQLCDQYAGECQRVYDRLSTRPDYDDGDRQLRLAGKLGTGVFEGAELDRWQIDVTNGGRVFYLIDPTPKGVGQKRRIGRVVIDAVYPGHPKQTERKPSGKRRPGRR